MSPAGSSTRNGIAKVVKPGLACHLLQWFDGRRFLYLARNTRGSDENVVVIGSLDEEAPVPLLRSPAAAAYGAGHLLFLQQQSLMAQPFDARRLELTGEARAIAHNVFAIASAAIGYFAVSRFREMVYFTGRGTMGSAEAGVGRQVR